MNNKEYRDLFLDDITNKRTKSTFKTVLNIFLGLEEEGYIKTKTLKNFVDKSVLDFTKRDIKDFFNLLNKNQDCWSLSSKRTMFPKVKKFLIWMIDYYLDDPNDDTAKQLYYMRLVNFLNRKDNFKFAKDGHKTSDSNKSVVLEIEELKSLFKAIMDYSNEYTKAKPIYSIMYRLLTETGCRIMEFCSVVLDAKINSHSIPIEEDLKDRKIRVKWIKTEDKEQKNFKFYPISEDFQAILLNYVKSRRTENKENNKLPNSLFITKKETVMTVSNMYTNIKRYCRKAGITKSISPHVFRHSLNVHRFNLGCPEDVRAILLNHGTGNINTDTYLKDSQAWTTRVQMFDDFYPYEELFNI